MHFLQFFYIDDNLFTGNLPVCLGTDMQFLRELHVRCNSFEGTIPAGFETLQFMIELHASCNADLSCDSPLASRPNFIFQCGMSDCENCSIPGTNCPNEVLVPDCGVYVR